MDDIILDAEISKLINTVRRSVPLLEFAGGAGMYAVIVIGLLNTEKFKEAKNLIINLNIPVEEKIKLVKKIRKSYDTKSKGWLSGTI